MSEVYGSPTNSPKSNINDFLDNDKEKRKEQEEWYNLICLMKELEGAKVYKERLYREIKENDKKISKLENMVYSQCKHNWKIDRSSCGEHTEYICDTCGMYK